MKNFTLIFFFSFLFSTTFYAQMHTLDPQNQWYTHDASISNLVIDIEPSGAYVEVAYTFDLHTAESDNFNNETQLEFVFDFELLNSKASFNDSWLWIENYISKGEIYEREEGTEIYEGIVDRRQDPSILTKHSEKNYQLRVYPLFPDSTRKVKISYLEPLNNQEEFTLRLPLYNFSHSAEDVTDVKVNITVNDEWMDPIQGVGMHYEGSTDNTRHYNIFSIEPYATMEIKLNRWLPAPFLHTYYDPNTDENYYQMHLKPDLEESIDSINHLFVLDRDSYHHSLNWFHMLYDLRSALYENRGNSKVNILYSDLTTETVFEDWKEINLNTLNELGSSLSSTDLGDESNLPFLLDAAIELINESIDPVHLHLISSNASFGSHQDADMVFELLANGIQKPETVINIYDTATENVDYSWISGESYYGNGYLYNIITDRYNGIIRSKNSNETFNLFLYDVFTKDTDFITDFDFHVSLPDGFTYQNFLPSNFGNEKLDFRNGITIVGKYSGSGPMSAELVGFYNDNPVQILTEFTDENIFTGDILTPTIWSSNYILTNENSLNTNTKFNVVEESKQSRVLSKLTTFLCLEADSLSIGEGLEYDGWIIATDDIESNSQIKVSPNPVTSNFSITLGDQSYITEDIRLELIDARGAISNLSFNINRINNELILDSSLDEVLPDGIYYLRIILSDQILTKKIIKISPR